MSILDPAIRLVGRLSFRNKMRATAAVFGLPLVIALGVILAGLGARVSAVRNEREALALQLPALKLLVNVHQYLAASQALREGAEQLGPFAQASKQRTATALKDFATALAAHQRLSDKPAADGQWLTGWQAEFDQVERADVDDLAERHTQLKASLRNELDRINEDAGVLVDGETSSSRLLDIVSAQLPELIDTTGQAARLGAVVLVNQRVKSSRRTELTLLRGNFNALVQWSMNGMQKVAREHPELAASLDEASSTLNTAYLGIQEAMTTKMLDTTDFDMSPATFLGLTAAALDQSLAVAGTLARDADQLLAARESTLRAQRNGVVLAMVAILALVIAGFVAAYISIMRGLNGLSAAVNTMAAGDLSARVEVSSSDEIGAVGTQFNLMVESLAQRTALLREKTNDIQNILHHMPQGILTIVEGGAIHAEYSDYLESIFETKEVKGKPAIAFLFGNGDLSTDTLAQVDAATAACLGEDRMNFDFNAHLLVRETAMTMSDGRIKFLEMNWSPICNDDDRVEKIMVCVRDVSELRLLEAEAEQQKRELQMIGQILSVSREKFAAFIANARGFVSRNEALLGTAVDGDVERVNQLFRNMHTIKGNARTYGLSQLTDIVHQAEQAYDELRKAPGARFDKAGLLAQLHAVAAVIDEYASLSEVKLGRQGAGHGVDGERYVTVERSMLAALRADLETIDLRRAPPAAVAAALRQARRVLRELESESIETMLESVFASLPSLAAELGKEAPRLRVNDGGIRLRRRHGELLCNVFMHLCRNSIDHGIETIAERSRRNKRPAGTIEITAGRVENRLELRLADDGQGLALGHIRRQAVSRGLIAEGAPLSDEALARLIFAPGFSTASAVTEVSGRGVGMDAVLNFLKNEGGEIRLEFSDPHEGAEYRPFVTVVSLPASCALDPQRDDDTLPGARHVAPGESSRLDDLRAIVTGIVRPTQWGTT